MKKLFYVVLLIVALLVIAHFVKNNKTPEINGVNVEEITTVTTDNNGVVTSEDDAIIIDETSDTDATIDSVEETVEEDIIEENPSITADDGETIVSE